MNNRKQNNDKINNRLKELTVDILTDEQEKSTKYQEAFNMNFQKTKQKGKKKKKIILI